MAGGSDRFDALLREVARVSDVPLAAPAPPLAIGDRLCDGRFEIAARLGSGGMGTVYEALDHQLGARIALKTLHATTPDWLRRIRAEFVALQDLSHPNLIELGELCADGGRWFFTMEKVTGVDFSTRVRPEGELDEGRLRRALPQLVDALAALHAAGKVHRDVKPSNVLVAGERVVLLDFGLVSEGGPTVDAGGTLAYMAPEQACGEATPAADWYAVGVMLHEALTGRLPFVARGPALLAAKQVGLGGGTLAGAPADLAELCAALLAPTPRARPDGAAIAARLGLPARAAAPTRFVGRTAELAALRAAWADARRGTVAIHVRGPSGVGKSALLERFAAGLAAEGALVLAGRCYERVSVPYKALDGVAAALAEHLRGLGPAAAELVPDDGPLLTVPFPVLGESAALAGAPPAIRDPQELRSRVFDAFRALLGRLAARRPLALIIDDLQWADPDGLALLEHALRGEPACLVVLAARDGAAPPIAGRELAVGALDPADAGELVRRLAPGAAAEIAATIAGETAGHPLHIVELVRHWQVDPASPRARRLDEAIAERGAALPEEPARLLALVSLAGGPLPQTILRRAAALDGAGFWSALGVLRAAHLVRTHGPRGEDSVEAHHDRVREAVAGRVPDGQRRDGHRRLAVALQDSPVAGRQPELLVHHWEAAGERGQAAGWAERAAEHSAAALAFERAAELFARALELDPGEPARVAALETRAGDALAAAGRGGPAAEAYLRAAAVDAGAALELRRRAAEQLLRSGRMDQGLELIDDVLREVGLPPLQVRWPLASLVWQRARLRVRLWRGPGAGDGDQLRRRLDCCWSAVVGLAMVSPLRSPEYQARHLRLALDAGDARRISLSMVFEAIGAAAPGPPAARAHALLEETARWAERADDPLTRGYLEVARGTVAFLCGRWRKAFAHTDLAERIFRDECVGAAWEVGTAQRVALTCLLHLGRIRELSRRVGHALEDAERRGDLYTSTQLRTVLEPNVCLMEGRPDAARAELAIAAEQLARRGIHLQHWQHMQATALLSLYEGDGAAALAHLDERWAAMRGAFMFRIQAIRIFSFVVRSAAALAAGQVDRAEADRRRLAHEAPDWPAATLVSAQLALLAGDRDRAERELRAAADGFAALDMSLVAAIARARWGELVGGDAGRAAKAAAIAAMAAEGIARPDPVMAMFAPVQIA